ncbi:uncharacterized protein LOC134391934 [Elgaria multicarinata webbii]|uniref:uncharacterized protein LOC134391934 n=1 Tax=Elgaria multicarinata webbii TaxID=159646 RepID=UPI002FCD5D3F
MLLPAVLLLLAAILQQSLEEDKSVVLSDTSPEKQVEIIDMINSIRRDVTPTARNMLKVTWSREASRNAKRWAAKCQFRSSPQEDRTTSLHMCGESITQTMIAKSWSDVFASWADKKVYYKYGVGPTDPKKNVYSYTQIIWYNSYLVGCALAYCPMNTFHFLYVCHFCPGGNTEEKITTPYKEGPTCADCLNNCEDKLCKMLLPPVLMPLAAMLQLSLGQGKSPNVLKLSKKQQVEIIDEFNSIRREVNPTARNMLKMSWNEKAAESAEKWATQCQPKVSPLKDRLVDEHICGVTISQSNFVRTWSDVIKMWKKSKSSFQYGNMSADPRKMSSPYTQNCTLMVDHHVALLHNFRGNILEMLPKPYKEGPSCGDCRNNCEDKLCRTLLLLSRFQRQHCRKKGDVQLKRMLAPRECPVEVTLLHHLLSPMVQDSEPEDSDNLDQIKIGI